MAAINIEALLKEVDLDEPAGKEEIEYDPVFEEMARAAESVAAHQMGDAVTGGHEADWQKVKKHAIELFARSKDMQVAIYLCRALIHTTGFQGFSEGLKFYLGLLEQYWDDVHPRLEVEFDNDPTMRMNILASLADYDTVLSALRTAPLVSSPIMGTYSLRDIDIANGVLSLSGDSDETAPEQGVINGAFLEAKLEDLQSLVDSLKIAKKTIEAIDEFVTGKVETSFAPDLSALTKQITEAEKTVNGYLEQRGIATETTGGDDGVEGNESKLAPVGSVMPTGAVLSGQVNSPDDVLKALNKVIDYYQRSEPSSPIPLLLERAKSWVSKGFFDILGDMAPDGLNQARVVTGTKEKSEESSW